MDPHRPSPDWIAFSGLPRHLAEACKSPLVWPVFRAVVDLDCARQRLPGVVEVSLADLGALCGLPAEQVGKALRKARKAGVLRCFLPDNDEEEALLQVVAPLPTPISWEQVRRAHAFLREAPDHAFRYARAATDEPVATDRETADPKLREVIDLYFNTVSMKMNAFILDELALIARQFDLALVRKVFARARAREVQGLSWILSEVRREQRAADEAKEKRSRGQTGPTPQ
jgi:hypothetical protein